MGAVYFYHLTRRPLEATLPMLLDKALDAGWRVLVRGTESARLDWLDEKLWLGPEDGFLPMAARVALMTRASPSFWAPARRGPTARFAS